MKEEKQINKNRIIVSNNHLPKRSDRKYLRIEEYQDYEFTHCIAYEMAIRNEEVIKLTKLLENLNILNKELFLNIGFANSSNITGSMFLNIIFDNFCLLINQYENDYLLYIIGIYNHTTIQTYKSRYNEEENFKSLFNKASIEDKIHIIIILSISVELKLEREYYIVNEQKSITPTWINKLFPKDTNYEPNEAVNNHIDTIFTDPDYKENYIYEKGYISYQGGYEGDNSFNINEVTPNFDKPLRMFNTMKISINPSLPLNDILSFVKKVKEDYDKNNSFKSFFELTVEKLIPSDDETTVNKTISFSKQKWADMFYIYDYFKVYLSNKNTKNTKNREDTNTTIAKEISIQLSYYHILKNKFTLDFSESAELDNYESAYDKYETNLLFAIKDKIEENKEYNKYIKLKKNKDGGGEEIINFYISADHIKTDSYPKMKKLIEGLNPEYIKFVGAKNHDLNSFINGKNRASSDL